MIIDHTIIRQNEMEGCNRIEHFQMYRDYTGFYLTISKSSDFC